MTTSKVLLGSKVGQKRQKREVIQDVPEDCLGKRFKTNRSGDIIVEEYITSKKIVVRFVKSGNKKRVQRSAIETGSVYDNALAELKKRVVRDTTIMQRCDEQIVKLQAERKQAKNRLNWSKTVLRTRIRKGRELHGDIFEIDLNQEDEE